MLENGTITEFGRHEELIEKKGKYCSMYNGGESSGNKEGNANPNSNIKGNANVGG